MQKSLIVLVTCIVVIGLGCPKTWAGDKTDFNKVLIEAEKTIIEVLQDFKKEGKEIAFGYEAVLSEGSSFAVNNRYMTTSDNIPLPSNKRQLFMEPYVAEIPYETQGYCKGKHEVAKMFFVPPVNPLVSNYGTDSNGQAFILLGCGSFSKFNCSHKCKIEVRAGRWGIIDRAFGDRLFFSRSKAKQEIPKFKKDLKNYMLEAMRYLSD